MQHQQCVSVAAVLLCCVCLWLPLHFGQAEPGPQYNPQVPPGFWAEWTVWTPCSKTCGTGGTRQRQRACLGAQWCAGSRGEELSCVTQPLCQFGEWTLWTPWTPCSMSCGQMGTRSRNRACVNAMVAGSCPGLSTESNICNRRPCTLGYWAVWTPWTPCSRSCGQEGVRTRIRTCLGGACPGNEHEQLVCNRGTCSLGWWGEWIPWTPCNKQCGMDGVQVRTRPCLNGACAGNNEESIACNRIACPYGMGAGPQQQQLLWG